MPRFKTPRKLTAMPAVKGFRPYGPELDKNAEAVVLHFEEYEAFKMCDYDNLNHLAAAKLMQVSRPTFTRIYASARNKIARSLAEGRPLEIEGGEVYFESNWLQCLLCGSYFNQPHPEQVAEDCPLCGHHQIQQIEQLDFTNLQNDSL
ncbi:MAG: DUF134 domain-containing protein [Bacteroidales bacterium]|jgi:predicted DNA-binding protein (UPF0251 family)|nr:DUF134 domain-containing protein [Bacteroidales bacterium]MDD4087472.1 DUF134 domain-containing protein [Bacteroidales bacterium]